MSMATMLSKVLRRRSRIALAACLAAAASSLSAQEAAPTEADAGGSRVVNPGFEQGSNAWTVFRLPYAIEASRAKSGTQALRLDFERHPQRLTGALQTLPLEQPAPAPVTVGFWSRAEALPEGDGAGECRVRIYAHAQDKTFANQDSGRTPHRQSMNFAVSNSADWQYHERTFVFDLPIRTLTLHVQGSNAAGRAWFDDFDVRTVATAADASAADRGEPCTLRREATSLVLENRFLRAEIDYPRAGRVISLLDKRSGLDFTDARPMGGLFKDAVMEYGMSRLFEQFYTIEAVQETPDEVSVTLAGKHPADDFLTVEKTYALRRDAGGLSVRFRLANAYEAMSPKYYTLRHHNTLRIPGKPNRYFLPTPAGVRQVAEGSAADLYHRELVDGWAAVLEPERRVGVVCALDFAPLDFFYNWFGAEVTLEWFYKTVKVENGEAWETALTLLPFHGLAAVDGASRDCAVEFAGLEARYAVGATPAFELALASGITGPVDIEFKVRPLPEGPSRRVEKTRLDIQAGETHRLPVRWKNPLLTPTLLTCTVTDAEGAVLLEAHRPIGLGDAPPEYVFAPVRAKIPTVEGAGNLKVVRFTRAFESPHVAWARPLAGGPVKALGLVHAFTSREWIELAQRVDLDYDTVIFFAPHGVMPDHAPNYSDKDANLVLADLLKRKHYDVVVIGGVNGTILSPANVQALRRMVESGTGLVHVFPTCLPPALAEILPLTAPANKGAVSGAWERGRAHYLTTGIPLEALPEVAGFRFGAQDPILRVAGEALAAVGQAEAGRVAALGYAVAAQVLVDNDSPMRVFRGGLVPTPPGGRIRSPEDLPYPYWEYAYALLSKAVLWAAGREPVVRLDAATLQEDQCTVRVTRTPETPRTLEWRWLSNDHQPLTEGQTPFAAGSDAVTIPQPPRHGDVFLHLRLLEGGLVTDFAAHRFRLPAPLTVNALQVETVRHDAARTDVLVRTEITGTGHLEARLTDTHGRLVAQADVPIAGNGPVEFSLAFEQPLTRACRLAVTATGPDGVAGNTSFAWAYFQRGRQPMDDYCISVWVYDTRLLHIPEYLDDLFYGQLTAGGALKAGWLANAGGQTDPAYYAYASRFLWRHNLEVVRNNLAPQHLKRAFFDEAKKNYQETKALEWLQREPCLHDPDYLEGNRERIETVVGMMKPFEPLFYCLGDENSLTSYGIPFDFCFSEHTLKAFRNWLRTRHASLEALNQVYGTTYRSFDEVIPATTEQAQDPLNVPSWVDHRLFMDEAFAEYYRARIGQIQALDPGVPVTLSGTQNPTAYNGCDWFRMMQVFRGMSPYGGIQNELMRSFGGDAYRDMPYLGGYGQAGVAAHAVWQAALRGRGAGMTLYIDQVMLNNDFTAGPIESIAAETAELRQGIGKLLQQATPRHTVGVVFSPLSQKLATLTGREAVFLSAVHGWVELLNEAGYPWRFVDPSQLPTLPDSGLQALVLPQVLSLSTEEWNAVRQFAEQGGCLVADADIGAFDEHGRPAGAQQATDVFGIARPAEKRPLPGELRFGEVAFRTRLLQDGLAVTRAEVLGTLEDKPAVVRSTLGRGTAILMNFLLEDYPRMKGIPAENNRYLALLETLLDGAGVTRGAATVRQADGSPAQGCRPFLYEWDGLRYLGLLRGPKVPAEFRSLHVQLEAPCHVYDVRRRQSLGATDRIELDLGAGEATLLTLAPHRVEEVVVTLPEPALARGRRATVRAETRTEGGPAQTRILRVEVYNPAGLATPWYSANLLGPGGKVEGGFPTALNDAPGTWRIVVTDVPTGLSGQALLRLD